MATVDWPVALPPAPMPRGYTEQPPKLTIRTEMDAGPAKVRRRFSAGVRPLSCIWTMDDAQLATLDAFFTVTLEGGAKRFNARHPRTGQTVEMRFVGEPSYARLDGGWEVTAQLEVMP